ncbi:probable E3 ubiquitin-protein ligase HIP1 [Macadamia integrifolia]|uniref:probable E3 ubiquitin-protein ligase HIP1 n=1 Tax=Macadamia integrifolia TaxID=60698 RepID=UPI001C52EB67|nr:probable E3 ubiquitin-protein ligase HIP1 [Macadamia integrifolia]XP_042476957.1 probable E3 ubiquitin-protein ligase HIP1 [Macadamia integrifolia]XP_042476958.1 probable E3 ubiquitin-protein ligase HIP1 [Macadamia integrifolia]
MGHRHLFGTSQNYVGDQNQNQNHIPAEQHYVHLGRAGPPENGSVVFPIESISTSGLTFSSQWNSAMRSNEYPSPSVGMEVPHYRPAAGGSSCDPFLQPSAGGNFCPASQNYAHHTSSSSYYRNTIHGVEGSVVSSVGSSRRSCKRKIPATSVVCERGSTSRYYGAGSSSDLSLSSNVQQEKPNLHSQHWAWDPIGMNPSYRGSSLSIGNEGSQRNVRSRSTLDLEANLPRVHLSSNVSRHPHSSGRPVDHAGMVDLAGHGGNAITWEWSNNRIPPTSQGRILASDTSGPTHETNQFLGVSTTNDSLELGGFQNGFISSRNPAVPPHNLHGNPTQAVGGGHSSYYQRSSTSAHRPSLGYPRLGHNSTSSEDGLQLASEAYPARHSRSLSTVGWHNNDRIGRPRISYERFRLLSDEADARERLVSEGLMIVERSAWYGSRNLLDQHREMRLDIDNMSYEELLDLGERIGSVSTGLSEDMISNSLTETIYCSSDHNQEEVTCVICLEEYKDREQVGTLKNCRHGYHVNCIQKWLSMKNVCPICKAPAIAADDLQEK